MTGAANFNNLIQSLSIPVLLLLEKLHIWSNINSGVTTSNLKCPSFSSISQLSTSSISSSSGLNLLAKTSPIEVK